MPFHPMINKKIKRNYSWVMYICFYLFSVLSFSVFDLDKYIREFLQTKKSAWMLEASGFFIVPTTPLISY